MFKEKYGIAKSKDVLQLSQEAGWIIPNLQKSFEDDRLSIKLTELGRKIIEKKGEYKKLRIQIKHMVKKERPAWLRIIPYGRFELETYFGSKNITSSLNEVWLCLNEARLLRGTSKEVIEWCDDLSSFSRGLRQDRSLEIGRIGERKTIDYEKGRTGKKPIW